MRPRKRTAPTAEPPVPLKARFSVRPPRDPDERRRPTPDEARALAAKVAAAEVEARRSWTPGEARIIALLEVLVRRAGGSVPSVLSAKDALTTEEAERYDAGWADVNRGFAGAARLWNRRGVEPDGGDLPPAGGTPPEEFFARPDRGSVQGGERLRSPQASRVEVSASWSGVPNTIRGCWLACSAPGGNPC